MPSFTYTGPVGMYYPTLGLSPQPGQSYDFDAAPDLLFVPAKAAPAAPVKE